MAYEIYLLYFAKNKWALMAVADRLGLIIS